MDWTSLLTALLVPFRTAGKTGITTVSVGNRIIHHKLDKTPRGGVAPKGKWGRELQFRSGTSRDTNYALSRFGIILITFLNTCVALPKRFVPKSDPILII